MAEIISISGRVCRDKEKRAASDAARKIESVRKFLTCANCSMRCAKCGIHIEKTDIDIQDPGTPFTFCPGCLEEYLEYQALTKEPRRPACYWYNREWMAIWKNWLDLQEAIDRYRLSKEFLTLVAELDHL
ncbi:MAG: hypothetical protein HQK57_15245 [Deltaproteobacteria bacterium]|nr:hypothetical protein [Deltaproteobacteria bacterium]MBF0510265.1 hypothetical protein [Deltaproteobacteria bacterium]MBF0523617.1 hypothetical protein [Deltaproteobacteria bacterium]